MKPNTESASDADWQIANQRADALKALLASSSPAAVAEVAADLHLSSAMVYRLLAIYRHVSRWLVPFSRIEADVPQVQDSSATKSRP